MPSVAGEVVAASRRGGATLTRLVHLPGDRAAVRAQSVEAAIALLELQGRFAG